ncbi:hypothetical protein ACFX19_009767 [Malus domestica]
MEGHDVYCLEGSDDRREEMAPYEHIYQIARRKTASRLTFATSSAQAHSWPLGILPILPPFGDAEHMHVLSFPDFRSWFLPSHSTR